MTTNRDGYHNLFVQIPLVLRDALQAESDENDESVARVVTRILLKHYKIGRDQLPRPKRKGRPPKNR